MATDLPSRLQQMLERDIAQLPDQADSASQPSPPLCVRGDHNTVVYAPHATAPIHITTREPRARRDRPDS